MSTTFLTPARDTWLCIPDLRAKKRDSALTQLSEFAVQAGVAVDAGLLGSALARRERSASSAIGKGVAVPHARSLSVIEPRLLIARAPKGIDWSSADDTPVVLIVVALCPAESSETAFYDLLARGLAIVKLQRHRQKLIDAPTPAARQLAVRELGS